jgi:hypothetical protein
VVSNDDMYKIDEVKKLRENLEKLESDKYDLVLANPSTYHSINVLCCEYNYLGEIFENIIFKYKYRKTDYMNFPKQFLNNEFVAYTVSRITTLRLIFIYIFSKRRIRTINYSDFGIFSGNFLKKLSGFHINEDFINGFEDLYTSIHIEEKRKCIIDFQIGDMIGATLGGGENESNVSSRQLRNLANLNLFSRIYKL